MRVLLADGFTVYRAGMAAVLARVPGVEVCGEADHARAAAELAAATQPHLAIVAGDLPGGGPQAAACIRAAAPGVRIAMVVDSPEDVPWLEAMEEPADVYLPRRASARDLVALVAPAEVLGPR